MLEPTIWVAIILSFNRTILELKRSIVFRIHIRRRPFNRTILELNLSMSELWRKTDSASHPALMHRLKHELLVVYTSKIQFEDKSQLFLKSIIFVPRQSFKPGHWITIL